LFLSLFERQSGTLAFSEPSLKIGAKIRLEKERERKEKREREREREREEKKSGNRGRYSVIIELQARTGALL